METTKPKLLYLALTVLLVALTLTSLPSCGGKTEDPTPAAPTTTDAPEEKPDGMNSAETLVWEFRQLVKQNPGKSAEELATLYAALAPVKAQYVTVYGEASPTDHEPFFYGFKPEFTLPHYTSAYAVAPEIMPQRNISSKPL